MNDLIQILNINKSFETLKKIRVLKKISFKFKKGKIIVIEINFKIISNVIP